MTMAMDHQSVVGQYFVLPLRLITVRAGVGNQPRAAIVQDGCTCLRIVARRAGVDADHELHMDVVQAMNEPCTSCLR